MSDYYEEGVAEPPEPREPHLGRVIWTLLGGILGAAFVLVLYGASVVVTDGDMKFEVFAGILLTAVAVIVTVFGAVLAVLAFWGFSQMKRDSTRAAVNTAKRQVDTLIREEIASPEMERRIRNRVDEIALGNTRDRDFDKEIDQQGVADA